MTDWKKLAALLLIGLMLLPGAIQAQEADEPTYALDWPRPMPDAAQVQEAFACGPYAGNEAALLLLL